MSNIGNKNVFANNLKKYMQLNGKSRNEVCQALGFKYSTFVIHNQAIVYLERNVAMDKEWSIDIFTKNLKMYMEQFGKNQKEMAAIVGVSPPTFHDWLKGKKMPRMNNVQTKN